MPQAKSTILESWPFIKEDLLSFLSDTDGWIIAGLKAAHEAKDWERVRQIIEVMDMVHGMSHAHH